MYKARIKMQDDDGNWLVPNEVLLHVLKFVDNRKNVALTCKKLYSVTCTIDRNTFPLRITTEKLSGENFNSILNSERQFDEFTIDTCKVLTLEQYWNLKAISFKYGENIKRFIWESCKLSKVEILSLLQFLPNLESFSAIHWNLKLEVYEESFSKLELRNLTELKIEKCDQATIDFFTEFLDKNTLKILDIQGDPTSILNAQQSIKNLTLNVDSLNSQCLRNIKLSNLTIKMRRYKDDLERSTIQSIIENQPDLITLDLINCGCFDEDSAAFEAVCKLKHLKAFSMNIDGLSAMTFNEHFPNLNQLKSVEIESVEHDIAPVVSIIEDFSRQDMKQLEKLKIYLTDVGVPLNRIERMGSKFKNLKDLNIRCDHPLSLDSYLINMKNLENLQIDYHYSKEFAKLCNNFDFNSLVLKNLSLHGFGFGSDDVNWNEVTLLKLTEVVPNLEKLELDAAFPYNIDFIFKLKEKLPKLDILLNWSMTQTGEHYKKFDLQTIFDLKKVAKMFSQFSIELRLKAIDMDASRVKLDLCNEYNVAMTRLGMLIVIRMTKR
ncbi:CLUMA_CG009966, isoform A [Clunio marinus]|uniref:CLUMA_CG009966, isoform A n=1 Tax=Clunio marinus TaxID=568069 RepID=A0A1J1I8C2_9DIPT|nr:CLUMA_CG009966, isoform A [Clunio marinus]